MHSPFCTAVVVLLAAFAPAAAAADPKPFPAPLLGHADPGQELAVIDVRALFLRARGDLSTVP